MKMIKWLLVLLICSFSYVWADSSELHGNVFFKSFKDYNSAHVTNFEINPYFKINDSNLKYLYFKYGINFKNNNHNYHYMLWGAETQAPIFTWINCFVEFEPIIMFEGNEDNLPAGERSTQAIGGYMVDKNDNEARAELRKETNGDWLNTYSAKNFFNVNFGFIERLYAKYEYVMFCKRAESLKDLKPYMVNAIYGGELDIYGYTERAQIGLRKYINSDKNNWDIVYVFSTGIKF